MLLKSPVPKKSSLKGFLAVVLFALTATFLHSQQAGDYRSTGSGNWTNAGVWEVFNGTAWVPATTYPGQLPGTNDVLIRGGNTIRLGSTIPNGILALRVGDGVGATDTLEVNNNAELNTPLIDLQTGGFAIWTSNVTLTLPAGAAFVVSGGTLDDGRPCSAAKRLVIGSRIYSTCNGGAGADYSFQELNDLGGSLAVSPTSNSPACEGTDLTLFANPSGAGSAGATFSWTGTGPGGYTFSSALENPVLTGLAAGSYTFSITITDSSGFTSSSSVAAEVLAGVIISTQPADQSAAPGASVTFEVTASGVGAYQWEVSIDGGLNFSPLADGAKYTGSQTAQLQVNNLQASEQGNLFRVSLEPATPGCPTLLSQPALLEVSPATVISNRRITFRVTQ
jgi:hypothetical protein